MYTSLYLFLARLSRLPWLASLAAVGLICLPGLTRVPRLAAQPPVVFGPRSASPLELPPLRPDKGPTQLPPPRPVDPVLVETTSDKVLPISLDTVFRLAQDQNANLQVARAKLQEAFATRELAGKAWLPEMTVGTAWYRHEGGIQDEQGQLVHSSYGALFAGTELDAKLDLRDIAFRKIDAERKIWQQRGEVSKVNSETLLEASTTYIDLLTARSATAIALETEAHLRSLLDQARKLASLEPGIQVEVDRLASETAGHKQVMRKLREGAVAAAAKLIYLLGLEPCSELVLIDRQIVPLHLVDATEPCCQLVAKAQANGPGVAEMEGLLALINKANAQAQGASRFLPVFETRMAEGLFLAGPGGSSTGDNRLDIGIQVKWNVTELLTSGERQRINQARIAQAHLSYQDLRGRLAMAVQEAREASLSSAEQLVFAREQISQARSTYDRSQYRLTNIKGTSPSEVLVAVRSLGGAESNYLQALRDFDKAQLRLLVLMGRVSDDCSH